MSILTAGLYRVDLFQTYFNEQLLNTFWYLADTGADDLAGDLALNFDVDVMPDIVAIQNTSVLYTLIRVTPIFGTGIEVNRIPTASAGAVSGDAMPTFMAVSIRLNRTTSELRNGWKRFAGLVEANTGAQSFAGAYIAACETLANTLTNPVVGGGVNYLPYIVRKPFSTLAQSPNWEGIETQTGTVLNRPTTQSTRKTF